MGYDSDHPASEGEVGKCGVAIDSLEDMEILFNGIDLEKTTVSMTINSPASVLWAMYLVVAEKQGADWKKISGTIQNDILKEYIAQKEYIYPPAPSMRLVIDTFEFGSKFTPRFNTISISGYHIREAGSTALQELAFTLYDGVEYVEWARRRGLDVDEFGPRLSFFFNAHNDFFEEIAKYRAARKIWYRVMKDRFGAKNQRTWLMRFHTQTAGVSLPAQQPMNNIARVAIQALAAVLGGTQSLHTDSYDEALALPTEEAARIALRTQQIIAYESGVAQTVDPLGGSYFLENLTLQMENGAFDYFGKMDAMGGMVKAIERGYPQKEIAESSYQYQRAVEAKEKIIVGVNEFAIEEESPHTLYIDETVARQQSAKLKNLRARRSNEEVRRALDALKKAAAQEPKAGSQRHDLIGQHDALHRRCGPRLRHRRRNLRSAAAGVRHVHRSQHHVTVQTQDFCFAMLSKERDRKANSLGAEESLSKIRCWNIGIPRDARNDKSKRHAVWIKSLLSCFTLVPGNPGLRAFLLFVSVARPIHPPQLHVARLAHVLGLGVLIQCVFGNLRSHSQLVQLVSSVRQVAADAGHLDAPDGIRQSVYRVPRIRVSEAIV